VIRVHHAAPDPKATAERHCWSLAMLVYVGSRAMLTLKRERGGSVGYNAWRERVLSEAPELARSTQLRLFDYGGIPVPDLESRHLTWLWDLLSREPYFRATTRLDPAEPVVVLPAGSVLRFEMKRVIRDDVNAVLETPLSMRQSKVGRFELLPACLRLTVPVDSAHGPGAGDEASKAIEARLLGVKTDQIVEMSEKTTTVLAQSVNQAYTVTSIRCEPERSSHTGNVFEHVAWLYDGSFGARFPTEPFAQRDGRPLPLVKLRTIRDHAEQGTWPYPRPASADTPRDRAIGAVPEREP
jgi:hypothetical protein